LFGEAQPGDQEGSRLSSKTIGTVINIAHSVPNSKNYGIPPFFVINAGPGCPQL
jgi:hypothetical protein